MSDSKNLSVSGPGFFLGQEERIDRTLDGTLPAHIPAAKVTDINLISKTRLRRAIAGFAGANVGQLDKWLNEVADGRQPRYEEDGNGKPTLVDAGARPNPALAIQLFLAAAEFAIPKLKAVAIDINDGSGQPLKRMSMAELQAAAIDADTEPG